MYIAHQACFLETSSLGFSPTREPSSQLPLIQAGYIHPSPATGGQGPGKMRVYLNRRATCFQRKQPQRSSLKRGLGKVSLQEVVERKVLFKGQQSEEKPCSLDSCQDPALAGRTSQSHVGLWTCRSMSPRRNLV